MSTILSIARKDLRLLFRDRINFFFTFVFPLIYGIMFGFMFSSGGKPSRLALAVFDEDATTRSGAMVAALETTDGLAITRSPSRDQAQNLVRRGKVAASIVLPKGYGEAAKNVFSNQPATLEVLIDPSRRAESGLLQGKLMELSFRQLTSSFTDLSFMTDSITKARSDVDAATDMSPATKGTFQNFFDSVLNLSRKVQEDDAAAQQAQGQPAGSGSPAATDSGVAAWTPIKIDLKEVAQRDDRPQSSFQITLPQAAAWGLLGAVMAFAVSLVQERTQGTLVRLSVAPIRPLEILAGKSLACFVTAVLVQVFLLIVFGLLFGVRPTAPVSLALAIFCASFGFAGLMAMLAVLGRTEGGASGMGRAVLLLLTIFGGGAIPLMFMPPWMQQASGISPFKWAIVALEGGIWRNYSLAEMALPCGILLAVGVVGLTLAAGLFRRLQAS